MEVGNGSQVSGSGILVSTPVAIPCPFPPNDRGSNSTREWMGGGFKFAHLVQYAGSFPYSQVRAAISPLASAGVSVSSNLQESWSLQEAKEKEVQERWGRWSGRQGQISE